ncbi:MAG: hypothetical protein DMG14_22210 [Acidobacteria bacterium]|nr:MAG: hypothetical protein DMG14_22210 [Acidobacteriota bacterium]
MTPEELNRTIEFIIETQARLAAGQEQDRRDRIEFPEWPKDLSAQVVRLLNQQSQRLDRLDKFYEDWLKQNGDFQQQMVDLQRRALHLWNLILDRLPPAPRNNLEICV